VSIRSLIILLSHRKQTFPVRLVSEKIESSLTFSSYLNRKSYDNHSNKVISDNAVLSLFLSSQSNFAQFLQMSLFLDWKSNIYFFIFRFLLPVFVPIFKRTSGNPLLSKGNGRDNVLMPLEHLYIAASRTIENYACLVLLQKSLVVNLILIV